MFKKLSLSALILIMALTSLVLPIGQNIKAVQAYSYEFDYTVSLYDLFALEEGANRSELTQFCGNNYVHSIMFWFENENSTYYFRLSYDSFSAYDILSGRISDDKYIYRINSSGGLPNVTANISLWLGRIPLDLNNYNLKIYASTITGDHQAILENVLLAEPFTNQSVFNSILELGGIDVNTYSINFNTNGGNAIESLSLNYNETITLPTPTREGYEFEGWFADLTLTIPFTTLTMPANDLTLYAGWTSVEDPTGPGTEEPIDPNEEDPTPGEEEPEQPESLLEILIRKLIDPLNDKVFNPLNETIFKPIYMTIIKPLADLIGAPLWSVWTGFVLSIYIILRLIIAAIFKRKETSILD